MSLKNLLQGKPFKHPLHPALVHLPIGLFALSFVLDLASLGSDSNALVRGAFYTMLVGIIGAGLAAVAGFADYSDIRADHPAKRKARTHMWLNLWAILLYAVNLLFRANALAETTTPLLPLVLSFISVGLISYSGYLGGVMVYDDGVGVGRHRRKPPMPDRTVHPKSTPEDGFVIIAEASSIPPGGSIRAEVAGHQIAIFNDGGTFHAIQDFCTHRYAPLSEGSLQSGQVMCPWHRSCFDLKTGKVTDGPAKVDLKTFEVRVSEGRVILKTP